MTQILKLSTFEGEIFEILYENNNVTFLWDGVDEISNNDGNFILDLINFVRDDSENRNLVSTRTFLAKKVEAKLNIEVFRLHPLKPSDRIDFIQKFMEFKGLNSSTFDEELKTIQSFFDRLLIQTCDEDNPLMLKMVCTIHFGKKELNLLGANTYSVYKRFIKDKFEITQKKDNFDLSEADGIMAAHQFYAIKFIYGNNSWPFTLDIMQDKPSQSFKEISRYGILQIDEEENFSFIHRTFAEYFVAQYVTENVANIRFKITNEELTTRLKFLEQLMDDSLHKFAVIRNFIDERMKFDDKMKTTKTSQAVVDTIVEESENFLNEHFDLLKSIIYHRFNKNILLKYFNFLASFYRNNQKIFRIYWKIENDENIFMYLIRECKLWKVENDKWLKRFIKFFEGIFTPEDLQKLMPWKSQNSTEINLKNSIYSSTLLYYIWREKHRLGKKVNPEIVADWAKIDDIQKLLDINGVDNFSNYVKETQTQESFKKFLISEFPEIAISLQDYQHSKFLNESFKNLNAQEMKQALIKHDYRQGSILHNIHRFTQDTLNTLLNFYEILLTKDEIEKRIYSVDSYGANTLNRMLWYESKPIIVDTFWNFILKYVKDIRKILMTPVFYGGDFALHISLKTKYQFEKFGKIYEQQIGKSELRNFIINHRRKLHGHSFIHIYLSYTSGDIDMLKFLNQTLEFSSDQMRKLFSARNHYELSELYIDEKSSTILDKNEIAPSCKLKVELPDALEKYEEIIEEFNIRELLDKWMDTNRNLLDTYTKILDDNLDKIEETLSKIDLQQNLQGMKRVVDTIGIEKIVQLSPNDIFLLVSNLDRILPYLNNPFYFGIMTNQLKKDGGIKELIDKYLSK